jgi:hypothetical protein
MPVDACRRKTALLRLHTFSVKERFMAENLETPNLNPQLPKTPESAPAAAAQPQIHIDDSKIFATYANFCRVTGTPEELLIDFGLNPQPFGVPSEPIPVTQRIVTNFYTAKRMLHALHLTIQRHEQTFGVLETDVQRRVQPSAARPA